jgi:hypothetical protein
LNLGREIDYADCEIRGFPQTPQENTAPLIKSEILPSTFIYHPTGRRYAGRSNDGVCKLTANKMQLAFEITVSEESIVTETKLS